MTAAATAMRTTAQMGRPSSGPRGAGKVPWMLPRRGREGGRESHKEPLRTSGRNWSEKRTALPILLTK